MCVKDRCAGKHLQFEPLEREGRERTKLSMVTFDCVFLSQKNADTTLEYENEPSQEVFQEVKIYSFVEGGGCENHKRHSVAQLDSSFRNAILEQK